VDRCDTACVEEDAFGDGGFAAVDVCLREGSLTTSAYKGRAIILTAIPIFLTLASLAASLESMFSIMVS